MGKRLACNLVGLFTAFEMFRESMYFRLLIGIKAICMFHNAIGINDNNLQSICDICERINKFSV